MGGGRKRKIFSFMEEASRASDCHTLRLLEELKKEGKDIFEYVGHLPFLRNNGTGNPKTRNSLGILVYRCLTGGDWRRLIPALSFIELSTIATYVLDDIIDNQPIRQADDSTWKRYGTNKAIIAGGLQTFISLKVLNRLDISDSDKLRVLDLANHMWARLWIGEGFNEEMKEGTTLEEYIIRCYDLCGVMFDVVSQISAICAGADEKGVRLASDIGKNYGIATMIRNDLADLMPRLQERSKALSKHPFEDVRKGIWTYPVIHATENAKEKEKEIVRDILEKECDEQRHLELCKLLEKCGSIDATLGLITSYREKANEHIRELDEGESRELLLDFTGLLENLRSMTTRTAIR